MSGADAAVTRPGNQPPHIERPARVLLGWLSPEEAALYQSGRGTRQRIRTCGGHRSDWGGIGSASCLERAHRTFTGTSCGVFPRGMAGRGRRPFKSVRCSAFRVRRSCRAKNRRHRSQRYQISCCCGTSAPCGFGITDSV